MRGAGLVIAVVLAAVPVARQFIFTIPAPSANPLSAGRLPGGVTTLPNPIWASAGVDGGVPSDGWTRCTTGTGTSVLGTGSTAAQIHTALSGCDANHYVELAAGTFNVAGITHAYDNRELRGQGMSTILNITTDNATWGWGGGCAVSLYGGGYTADAAPTLGSATNLVTWDGTNGASGVYTQGATLIDLSNATSYAVGDMIVLYQNDLADGSLPTTGWFASDKNGGVGNSNISSQGDFANYNASVTQRSMITAKNGNQVTISPGVIAATGIWRTSLAPKAGRHAAANLITNAGIRNLRINTSSIGQRLCDVGIGYAYNVWLKGVGIVSTWGTWHGSNSVNFVHEVVDSVHVEIRDGWVEHVRGGGTSTTTSYGVWCVGATLMKMENMIFSDVESPTEIATGCNAAVLSHNYENVVVQAPNDHEGGMQNHGGGSMYGYAEGNQYKKFWADLFHGNGTLNVFFRNYFSVTGVDLESYHRGWSVIGNAIAGTGTHRSCVSDVTDISRFSSYGLRLGYASESASSAASDGVDIDAEVCTSTMDWGNYSTVGGSVFNSANVPTTWEVPNTVPATQTLPPSLLYSTIPCWYTYNGSTAPFPLHGPDVTGGAFLSGHANKNSARRAFEAAGGTDGAYSSATIASFNPSLYCQ